MSRKLWGGAFSKPTRKEVEEFTSSIHIDSRLAEADLLGSLAHVKMLGKIGVLSEVESQTIQTGLESLLKEQREGGFKPVSNAAPYGTPYGTNDVEDIHSEIEKRLTEKIGPVAGKVHTGRSRNDQVATATRLYLRWQMDDCVAELKNLQSLLLATSENHLETILPGFTHLQHAQPISLAHHLMAYFWMLQRDFERLRDCRSRVNRLPLGSAALAGTSFPLDREFVARELGFEGICENSLDAVSDRDFVVEFLACSSLIVTHLSRLAEEIILWSTPEFGFVQLDDSVTTGSSLMPQKRNPDVAELIRGRTGRLTGALVGALTMLKGLPLSYNRDLQEDKEFLFMGMDTTRACLRLMRVMLESAKFKTAQMAEAARRDYSNATDLADDLVKKGIPFRQAHEVSGRVVQYAIQSEKGLEELSLNDLKRFSEKFDENTLKALDPIQVMRSRISPGGTGPSSLKQQLEKAKGYLN